MTNFELNKSLTGFKGIINRRNFIANYFMINAIITGIFAPLIFIIFAKKPSLILQLLGSGEVDIFYALLLLTTLIFYVVVKLLFYYPNILKRVRDITADEGDIRNHLITSALTIIIFAGEIMTGASNNIFQLLALVVIVALMCMDGKISSEMPKSEVAKFSWGAFFGTWIWGLLNKSYKTLWAIPLFLTPAYLHFAVACGIKGNEWAYKNTQSENLEKFHESQKIQAIIWSCLGPVLTIVASVLLMFATVFSFVAYAKNHPEFVGKFRAFYIEASSLQAKNVFSEIKLEKDEYKFYIEPKEWNYYSTPQQFRLFNSAGAYVVLNSKIILPEKELNIPTEILEKVKIYSSFNNELLGEFKTPENLLEDKNNLRILQEGFRSNNHPSLP